MQFNYSNNIILNNCTLYCKIEKNLLYKTWIFQFLNINQIMYSDIILHKKYFLSKY